MVVVDMLDQREKTLSLEEQSIAWLLHRGNIETINRSLISTSNKRSPGLVAQSIGGGGFILSGESAVLGSKNEKENRLTLNERAGNTKLINKGDIQTQGEHSMGVIINQLPMVVASAAVILAMLT